MSELNDFGRALRRIDEDLAPLGVAAIRRRAARQRRVLAAAVTAAVLSAFTLGTAAWAAAGRHSRAVVAPAIDRSTTPLTSAPRRIFRDPVGDVTTDNDISRVTVTNGQYLVVEIRVRHLLTTSASIGNFAVVWLDTTPRFTGPEFFIAAAIGRGAGRGNLMTARQLKGQWTAPGPGPATAAFCDPQVQLDRVAQTVTISVPRICLTPARSPVRVNVSTGPGSSSGRTSVDSLPAGEQFLPAVPSL